MWECWIEHFGWTVLSCLGTKYPRWFPCYRGCTLKVVQSRFCFLLLLFVLSSVVILIFVLYEAINCFELNWIELIVNTEPSGTVHRKYTGLPRRIDRNEYYFALLYIVRQVTIPYSALQFRRNSAVFWCFEIPCQDIRYRVAHACGSRCTRGCKHRAPLWVTENICLPMWILSIAISIIDLNVHRWSTTKLM